jgi:alcohol dehydrogenase
MRFELPVEVTFGDGVAAQLADHLVTLGVGRAAIVVDEPVAAIAPVAATLASCSAAGIDLARLTKPSGEPTFAAAEEAGRWLHGSGADAVVAIGGGSTIDLAKAARLLAEHGGPLDRYLHAPIPAPRLPLIALPTTSGTGSEVSLDAVLTDETTHTKVGFNSTSLRPEQALVDPLLSVSLPPGPTAYAGVDALAQAIGGVITTRRNPVSVALGLEACQLVGHSLERGVRDGSDLAARRELAAASLLAGLSMSVSECAAEHSVGQAIGGLLGLPHGLTIGLVLAETMEVNRPECADELERIADALGAEHTPGLPPGGRAIAEIRRLLAAVGFPTLRGVGFDESHVDELVTRSLRDDFVRYNPHSWTESDFRAVYAEALALAAR